MKDPSGTPVTHQDARHTWDAGGNLAQRQDVLASETESFGYDFLDRLTSTSGPYSESYAYNQIGNMTSKNGLDYRDVARQRGASYFDLGDAGKSFNDAEKSAANVMWLDQQIASGQEFFLANIDSLEAMEKEVGKGGGLGSEIEYLIQHDYVPVARDDGVYLVPKG